MENYQMIALFAAGQSLARVARRRSRLRGEQPDGLVARARVGARSESV